MSAAIKPSYEIEAAMLKIKDDLAKFNRGDDIADKWIFDRTGVDPKRLESRIRSFFCPRGEGITIERRGNCLHLHTHTEQRLAADKHRQKAARQDIRSLNADKAIDADKLTDGDRKARELNIRYMANRVMDNKKYETEHRALLGVPAPSRPQLKAGGST